MNLVKIRLILSTVATVGPVQTASPRYLPGMLTNKPLPKKRDPIAELGDRLANMTAKERAAIRPLIADDLRKATASEAHRRDNAAAKRARR
jgi:ribosomal protein S2